MTSHKQVVWLSDGSAYYWSLPVNSIAKVSGKSYEKAVLQTILTYEGWEQAGEVEDGAPLFAAMTTALPTETVNLSGLVVKVSNVLSMIKSIKRTLINAPCSKPSCVMTNCHTRHNSRPG